MACTVMDMFDEHVHRLDVTAKDFKDESIVIENPRMEAANIFEQVRVVLHDSMAKRQAEAIKMLGALFNNMLLLRR